jgi:hypothetical protein
VNAGTFERAMLAAFAYQQARHTGSFDSMKGVAYIVRNRVLAGWGDGSYLAVMNAHSDVTSDALPDTQRPLDLSDRLLQLLIRDIDEIYNGTSQEKMKDTLKEALYFQFITQPPRQWFEENIIRDPEHHPLIASMGIMVFFK